MCPSSFSDTIPFSFSNPLLETSCMCTSIYIYILVCVCVSGFYVFYNFLNRLIFQDSPLNLQPGAVVASNQQPQRQKKRPPGAETAQGVDPRGYSI